MINSDSETVDHQQQQGHKESPQAVTLEYLINENKMKEIALNKATNLIDLLKLELEVEKNSQQETVEAIELELENKYQAALEELQRKIDNLEEELELLKEQLEYEKQSKRVPEPKQRNSHSQVKSKSLIPIHSQKVSRSSSRQELVNEAHSTAKRHSVISNSHSQNRFSSSNHRLNQFEKMAAVPSTGRTNEKVFKASSRVVSGFYQPVQKRTSQQEGDLFAIEKQFLLSYLLEKQEKDAKLFAAFDEQSIEDFQSLTEMKRSLKQTCKAIDEYLKLEEKRQKQHNLKIKQYSDTLKVQEIVIVELNKQIQKYEQTVSIALIALNPNKNLNKQSIFESNSLLKQSQSLLSFNIDSFIVNSEATTDDLCGFEDGAGLILNLLPDIKEYQQWIRTAFAQFNSNLRLKISNMESENKELKRILDEMIRLIKLNGIKGLNTEYQSTRKSSSTNFRAK